MKTLEQIAVTIGQYIAQVVMLHFAPITTKGKVLAEQITIVEEEINLRLREAIPPNTITDFKIKLSLVDKKGIKVDYEYDKEEEEEHTLAKRSAEECDKEFTAEVQKRKRKRVSKEFKDKLQL